MSEDEANTARSEVTSNERQLTQSHAPCFARHSLTITECSDDCLSPIEHVSIKSLPPSSSSSSYAILNRVDRAVDSTVVLMAEMRYYRDTEKTFKAKGGFGDRVSEGEGFGGALPTVEEMQDIMVMVSDLSP